MRNSKVESKYWKVQYNGGQACMKIEKVYCWDKIISFWRRKSSLPLNTNISLNFHPKSMSRTCFPFSRLRGRFLYQPKQSEMHFICTKDDQKEKRWVLLIAAVELMWCRRSLTVSILLLQNKEVDNESSDHKRNSMGECFRFPLTVSS